MSSNYVPLQGPERQALEEQRAKTGTATDGVEHHETLQTGTLVGELTKAIEGQVDNPLADGVVAVSVNHRLQ